ncbi:hypothetical protein QFC22_000961 [Naganishia vaughanmartiniae]|uniref:Uncharacterized protein n=1 Tax=Naganishia vaughanmartiniae TaxID=1424756 RepID=A0ACC2XJK7_9TREE|nr:hypothetical protein QFC22_000961 [Naganishia vaughanmartiniae]
MQALAQPTLLVSFPVASSSKDTLDRLPLAIAPVAGAEQAEAVTAVQGNALWIHDLATHRAITSYTVPPSTTFHTKPISFHASIPTAGEQAKPSRRKDRRTAIVLKKGEGVGAELEGRVVWVWTGEEVFDKQAITLSHKARSLHHIPLSAIILATSPDSLTLLSPSLDATHLSLQPIQGGKATSALYSNLVKTLLPARSSPAEPISVVLVYSSGHVRLITIAHEQEQAFTVASERLVQFPKGVLVTHEIVVDAHLDEVKGGLHYYTNNNRMLASVLNIKTPTAQPNLSTMYTFSSTSAAQVPSNGRLTTVPTGSGALLLIASPPSLALFHPSYPAVIDARDLPRSAATNVQQVTMLSSRIAGIVSRTSASTDSNGSAAGGSGGGGEKDVVYLVEVTVPPSGVGIAQLLSSAERTARFITPVLATVNDTPATTTPGAESSVAARDAAFLDSFSSALSKSDAQAAQDVFNAYEIAEGDPFALRTKKLLKIREGDSAAVKARSTAGLVGEILRRVFYAALTNTTAAEGVEGEALVRKPDGVYPAVVVRSLIRREWVSEGMWPRGGVVRALLALGDWESIMLALPRLPAVPSASLVAALSDILHKDAATKSAPTLAKFLEAYTRAPCSAALHRRALHTGLSAADACAVLDVFCGWLESVKEQQESGGWCDGLTSTWVAGEAEKKVVPPVMVMKDVPVSSVIQHTQLILDAHLPSLIAYLPAHALLERLDAALQPLLSAQNALVAARGTVDAFIKLSRREEKQRAGHNSGKKGGKSSGVAGRSDGVAFDGVYSVEEIQL